MGEIADMMLEGTLCAGCGEVLDSAISGDEPAGFPQYCSDQCVREHGAPLECVETPNAKRAASENRQRQTAAGRTHPCPTRCGRKFRSSFAAEQHARDKHGWGRPS